MSCEPMQANSPCKSCPCRPTCSADGWLAIGAKLKSSPPAWGLSKLSNRLEAMPSSLQRGATQAGTLAGRKVSAPLHGSPHEDEISRRLHCALALPPLHLKDAALPPRATVTVAGVTRGMPSALRSTPSTPGVAPAAGVLLPAPALTGERSISVLARGVPACVAGLSGSTAEGAGKGVPQHLRVPLTGSCSLHKRQLCCTPSARGSAR